MVLVGRRSCRLQMIVGLHEPFFPSYAQSREKTPRACARGVWRQRYLLNGDVECDDGAHWARKGNDGGAGLDCLEARVRLVGVLRAAL